MRHLIVSTALLSLALSVSAEPEIKGSPTELANYLNGMPKIVRVPGEAEVRVPAHRAMVTLRVVTENHSLQEALRANLDTRNKIADQLRKEGISADRIQASKFSSTPKFGMFSEKAKSYRVENLLRISVLDEKEFQTTAAAVDLWSEVQFGGVEFEYADKEALKARAISQACDDANGHIKTYEEKFGLKLTVARFDAGEVMQREAVNANYASAPGERAGAAAPSISLVSSPYSVDESTSSFGELVYTAHVVVECTAQPK